MQENQAGVINRIAKIKDQAMEREFEKQEYSNYRGFLLFAFVALGLLYTAFIIPQFFYTDGRNLGLIVYARLFSLICFIVFTCINALKKSVIVYKITLGALEFIFPLTYLLIVYLGDQFDFLIKCLDVIVIITVISIIPSDWILSGTAAAYMIGSFITFTVLMEKGVRPNEFYAGITYVILIYLISLLYGQRFNCYKRRKFLNLLYAQRLIETDALTGISSRTKFNEVCRQYIGESDKNNTPLCLSVFDIDDFKRINDTHGHLTGDMILISLCNLIAANLNSREFFARWGGEEFVIILPGTILEEAVRKLNLLREKISAFEFISGIRVTCSFGVASKRAGDDTNTLFDYADKLLYTAKDMGKNLVLSAEKPE